MKRKLTLPLIVLVIVLWGLIFYRLFSGGGDDGVPTGPQEVRQEQPAMAVKPGMDSLLLDYPDPFLGHGVAEPEEIGPWEDGGEAYVAQVEEPYIDWSQVQYFGMIRGEGGMEVALVNISGREYMLKIGDTLEGYTLLGHTGSSLSLRYQGQVGAVAMQHAPPAESHTTQEHEYP